MLILYSMLMKADYHFGSGIYKITILLRHYKRGDTSIDKSV